MVDKTNFEQLAYDNAPIGIVMTEQRIVKSCNATFADMLGYQKIDILEQSFRMFYATCQEFDDIRDIGIEPLRTKGVYCDERMVKCKSGSQVWCRFRAQALNRDEPLEQAVLSFALISENSSAFSFTPRERQVITHLSTGMTSKEIGFALGISPRTVEDIRRRLLKKFKVRNAAELLARLNHIPH